MSSSRAALRGLTVGVIARDSGFIAGVKDCMRCYGAAAIGTSELTDATKWLRGADCIILYPDEYSPIHAIMGAVRLERELPNTLLLIVTYAPGLFWRVERLRRRPSSFVVIPRPIMGATLVATMNTVFRPGRSASC